jgi:HSP20 family protein
MRKRWDTCTDTVWVRSRRNTLLSQFVSKVASTSGTTAETSDPVIDVWEMENEIVVEGEIPGVSTRDFNLILDRGRLIVEGYKREPRYSNCQKFYRMEREFGFFKRIIELPASVNSSGIKASLVDGLLVVRLPKIEDKRRGSVNIPVSE